MQLTVQPMQDVVVHKRIRLCKTEQFRSSVGHCDFQLRHGIDSRILCHEFVHIFANGAFQVRVLNLLFDDLALWTMRCVKGDFHTSNYTKNPALCQAQERDFRYRCSTMGRSSEQGRRSQTQTCPKTKSIPPQFCYFLCRCLRCRACIALPCQETLPWPERMRTRRG